MSVLVGETQGSQDKHKDTRHVSMLAISASEAITLSADAAARARTEAAKREKWVPQADRKLTESLVWSRVLVPNEEGGVSAPDPTVSSAYETLEAFRRGQLEDSDPSPVTDPQDLDFLEAIKAAAAVSHVHHVPPYVPPQA